MAKAKTKTEEKLTDYESIELLTKFESPAEKKLGASLLRKYLEDFEIENVSDKNNLAQIIFLEVNQVRIQTKLNELYGRDSKSISQDLLDTLNKNTKTIIDLKNTLGLSNKKDKLTGYDAFEHLKKRFAKWQEENQVSRERKCPHCQQFVWWKISPEGWEAQKHPFFHDTFVFNRHLLEHLNQMVTIDREFIAKVFEVSPDYIDWIINKLNFKRGDAIEKDSEEINGKETAGKEEVNLEVKVS